MIPAHQNNSVVTYQRKKKRKKEKTSGGSMVKGPQWSTTKKQIKWLIKGEQKSLTQY